MSKKASTAWNDAIRETGKKQQEIDNLLSPSKGQIPYIKDYAKALLENATHIDMASALAHEKVISFEQAQQIINFQKQEMIRKMEYLKQYLSDEN
ncbi:hypothetical protein PP175_25500 (plasmid) [Aneurinibacillus sp. Ricciae_BoGa-3]|uniref:hypothetical protein n=1 Tax=Aneurinibacillus sp. Ricciae_BoGa-3 TaxID=3022697 RepID=UPI00233FDEB1|nr:hypothetical protein [Aneurinibacillus sp. Ricciae_BoGa-3]WCK57426.1 hypothetical protein PP175_25500 [Aneurinibacillus sp. Ricciae_BoGa-3]